MQEGRWLKKLSLDGKGRLVAYRRGNAIAPMFQYLKDFNDSFKGTSINATLASGAVEAGDALIPAVGHALASAWAPIKFVVTIAQKLTEVSDPDDLGFLAFSLTFGECLGVACRKFGVSFSAPAETEPGTRSSNFVFSSYAWEDRSNHPFIRFSSVEAERAITEAGADGSQASAAVLDARLRFPSRLRLLLTHPDTKDFFSKFTNMIRQSADSTEFWLSHQESLRRDYNDVRVLDVEPFSLAQVYEPVEAGSMSWGDLGGKNVDPLKENVGGRQDLLETTLKLIADPAFRDAIVIQGPAGAGKSSFTLKLANTLLDHNLYPVRVRFRDIRMTTANLLDAIIEAVESDQTFRPAGLNLRDEPMISEQVTFRGAEISPFVLILDGWDEVSYSSSSSYQQRVEQLLEQCRDMFVERKGLAPIRVIVTGRPSVQVYESKFLRGATRILTIKHLSPSRVRSLVCNVSERYQACGEAHAALKIILNEYENWYDAPYRLNGETGDILGQPFLAFLVTRLVSQNPSIAEDIARDSTKLLRALVEETCKSGARSEVPEVATRMLPESLRRLLRLTAVAASTYNREYIPFDELEYRLLALDADLSAQIGDIQSVLPNLMINFFFKGQRKDLGAEFLHKSFREYLLAEAIWEFVKVSSHKLAHKSGRERADYWLDFGDDRDAFCATLGQYIAPHWLSREVRKHLSALMESDSDMQSQRWPEVVRLMRDVWDWWLEGANQRPKPVTTGNSLTGWLEPGIAKWHRWTANYAVDVKSNVPVRYLTLDSHFGDGLFLIFHEVVKQARLQTAPGIDHALSSYCSNGFFTPFRDWGPSAFSRLNASGYRPGGQFPEDFPFFRVTLELRGGTYKRLCGEGCLFYSGDIVYLVAPRISNSVLLAQVVDNASCFLKSCLYLSVHDNQDQDLDGDDEGDVELLNFQDTEKGHGFGSSGHFFVPAVKSFSLADLKWQKFAKEVELRAHSSLRGEFTFETSDQTVQIGWTAMMYHLPE